MSLFCKSTGIALLSLTIADIGGWPLRVVSRRPPMLGVLTLNGRFGGQHLTHAGQIDPLVIGPDELQLIFRQ